jgi:hypothetical protein
MVTPPRQLRKVAQADVDLISMAIARLHIARAFLRSAGAKNAAVYVARALKSAEGAQRHAERCLNSPTTTESDWVKRA